MTKIRRENNQQGKGQNNREKKGIKRGSNKKDNNNKLNKITSINSERKQKQNQKRTHKYKKLSQSITMQNKTNTKKK